MIEATKPESWGRVDRGIAEDNIQNSEHWWFECKRSSFGDQVIDKICVTYEQIHKHL